MDNLVRLLEYIFKKISNETFKNRINTLKSKNHRFILRIHWKN